jgi:hypothetical protein
MFIARFARAGRHTQPAGQTSDVIHPAHTLLQRPELARHVRHVRETGRVLFLSRLK